MFISFFRKQKDNMAWTLPKIPTFREAFEFNEKTKGELRQLLKPYYIVNLILAFSFLFVKLTRPFCELLFAPGPVR